jgi:nucleoside 2-deoxyribosyltransferase
MAAASSQKRANIELILLGFLVSLILKGLLDHVYSADLEHAKGWHQVSDVIVRANFIEVLVFLFALLRFMYGAYRFHELGPEYCPTWQVCWDLGFMVTLFIGFYLSSVLVKYQPIQFYELFAVTHIIDLIWFLRHLKRPFHLFKADGEAPPRFVVLDLLTLAAIAIFFSWSGLFASAAEATHPLYILGLALIAIGFLDLWWNRRFYFHRIGSREQAAQALPTGAIYFAGPLFTQAEWRWNKELAASLEHKNCTVILPQQIALEVLQSKKTFDPKEIYDRNILEIEKAAAVIAILDGADPDSGTSWECGYAHRAGTPVIGIRTDLRAAGDDPSNATNLMLGQSCFDIVQAPAENREDIETLATEIEKAMKRLKKVQDDKKPKTAGNKPEST